MVHAEATRVPSEAALSTILENSLVSNPLGRSASRSFRFCIPDEWFRRSKSRSVSSTSNVSQDTIRRLADLEEEAEDEDEEDEGGGTAKGKPSDAPAPLESPPGSGGFKAPMDWRGSVSQHRFSSILDSWMRPQSPTTERPSTPTPEKKVVSEPKLVEHKTGDSTTSSTTDEQTNGVDPDAFEQMLVCVYM